MQRIIIYILLVFCYIHTNAQVNVEQKVSQVDILIGEQVELETTVHVDAHQHVVYPTFPKDVYMDGVEVVSEGKIDTILLNSGKRMQLSRTYKLTSFDSAFYALPPFYIIIEKDTFKANSSIGLKVTSVPVDTTNANEFAGPYTVTNIPFQWSYEFWTLLLINIILAVIAYFLYQRIKKNHPITKRVVITPPSPAHKTALEHFAKIKTKTPESEDEIKQYYDEITDVLRQYIEARFLINAKELTTQEIIDKLTDTNHADALRELREILTKADLVKFAKYQVSTSDANRSLAMALDYINTTRLPDEQLPKPEVKIVSIGETKQRNIRICLIVLMSITIIVALCILLSILTDIYECFLS